MQPTNAEPEYTVSDATKQVLLAYYGLDGRLQLTLANRA